MPMMPTLSFLRKNYCLVPLVGATLFGCGMGVVKLVRDTVASPDVSWRRYSNPEPWQSMVDENGLTVRFKLSDGGPDYPAGQTVYGQRAFPDSRPPIEKWWSEHRQRRSENDDHHH